MQPFIALLSFATAVSAQSYVLPGYATAVFVVNGVKNLAVPVKTVNDGVLLYSVGPNQPVVSQAYDAAAKYKTGVSSIRTDLLATITNANDAITLMMYYKGIASQFVTLASNYGARKYIAEQNGQRDALRTAISAQRDAALSYFVAMTNWFQGDAVPIREPFGNSVIGPAVNALGSASAFYNSP